MMSSRSSFRKFQILIHDDWEVHGNGLGNVADLQYLPALSLMRIAEQLKIKLSFMVEVAHRLAMARFKDHDPDIKVQADLWDDTVRMMAERGFDVQLHLHPQWLKARYEGGLFVVEGNRNLGCYPKEAQQQLIHQAVDHLSNLIRPIRADYKVIAFKAGCWGLQPSEPLLSNLAQAGIRIVLGVRYGLHIPAQHVDYTSLEEPCLPYHPRMDDVTKVSEERNDLVLIPLQPYAAGLTDLLSLGWHLFLHRIRKPDRLWYKIEKNLPVAQAPSGKKRRFSLSLRPYRTHLKLGVLPFRFMKNAFDTVITDLARLDLEMIPILVECHTKDLAGQFGHVCRFLEYVLDRYADWVEFQDLSTFWHEIQSRPELVTIGSI